MGNSGNDGATKYAYAQKEVSEPLIYCNILKRKYRIKHN